MIYIYTYTYVYTHSHMHVGASLGAQMVKNLPAMRETWLQLLGWEDSLKKGMTTHSSILAWKIPWTEEFGGLQSIRSQRMGMTDQLTLSPSKSLSGSHK